MRQSTILTAGCLLLLAAGPAAAHPGHSGGFIAGFAHPFSGLDHMLAMLAVGLWAGLAGGRQWLAWPATFVAFMLAGFMAGLVGGPQPMVEAAIAASVIGLGLAVAFNYRAPLAVGAAAVAVFGLAHGYAHGQEGALDETGFPLGFTLATLALHAAGLGVAVAVRRFNASPAARTAGLGMAAAGLAMAWAG